jgi:hypothetical protein
MEFETTFILATTLEVPLAGLAILCQVKPDYAFLISPSIRQANLPPPFPKEA